MLGPSDATTEAQFHETFDMNVKVPFFLFAALAPARAGTPAAIAFVAGDDVRSVHGVTLAVDGGRVATVAA